MWSSITLAEGDERGPTLSFRGIDNTIFYMLADDKRSYRDYTGTGNTINANHPVVRDLILTALRHWVMEMHVDGFRFDLAAVLGRGRSGALLPDPPLLERIAKDPTLRHVKLIAEAWDAGGAYEVGASPDAAGRSGTAGTATTFGGSGAATTGVCGVFAQRICGSADIYSQSGKSPDSSINFVTLSRWLHIARSRELPAEAQ